MWRRVLLWVGLVCVVALEPAPPGGGGAVAGGGGRRGVLRVGVAPLGSLDPAQARSVEQLLVVEQLFESLTGYDPETLEPVPALASRWDVSADQRTWTFHLRPGARFANGRAVTAEDVKYSFERVARVGSGSPASELLISVSGYGSFRTGGPTLTGVEVVSPSAVRVSVEEPLAVLPSMLASPLLSVVPKEAVEAGAEAVPFAEAPVGSGPFRLAGGEGGVLSLVPTPGARVAVRRMEVVQYENVAAAYEGFTRGQVDWARVPPDRVEEASRRYGSAGFRPYVADVFYGFNLRAPALSDPRFREAIVRAVDREAVVAAVYQGTVAPAGGLVSSGLAGAVAEPCARCGHDVAESRRLLGEAFPGRSPPEVRLDYDADPTQEAMAEAVRASLESVGVKVVLRPAAGEAYDQVVLSGTQEVFRLGWVAAYPSPDAVLAPLFLTGSPNNVTGYSNPSVDSLLKAARGEPDAGKRNALFREAEQAIMDAVPVLPLAQVQLQTVVSSRVRGLVLTSMGTFDASAVSVG